jgi:hypothetical protein
MILRKQRRCCLIASVPPGPFEGARPRCPAVDILSPQVHQNSRHTGQLRGLARDQQSLAKQTPRLLAHALVLCAADQTSFMLRCHALMQIDGLRWSWLAPGPNRSFWKYIAAGPAHADHQVMRVQVMKSECVYRCQTLEVDRVSD